jgi:hypothetical protein
MGDRVGTTSNGAKLRVSSVEIAAMQAAASIVKEMRGAAAGDAGGPLTAVAAAADTLVPWQHYPAGDVYDPFTHAQYFFHTHLAAHRAPREHGHFHTFLRAEGMPPGVAPLVLPETAVADASSIPPQAAPLKRGHRDEVSHLVGVTVDAGGEPIRLFTTNRWVTGETWYRADDVIRMLDYFALAGGDGPVLLNRWLGAVVALFRPQITSLLRLRDEAVMGWRRRRRTNVFEDTRLEITSSLAVDIDAQLGFLDLLGEGHNPRLAARPPRPTRIAEGWDEGSTV